MKITTHINPNDLTEGWSEAEIEMIDVDASEQQYIDLLHKAIKSDYPDATVYVLGDSEYGSKVALEDCEFNAETEEVGVVVGILEADIYQAQGWVVGK